MNKKDIKYYMSLPYNYLVQPISDESGDYYYGRVLELDGCQSTGESFEEAYRSLLEAMEGWLEVKMQYNDYIPEPLVDESFSGKFLVRIPKSLHRRLSVEAQEEGVSLNQYAMYKLSR
ncbi:MAG: toxin-antitoxin system HicB family antitoxin [Tissierellaceae bacterium]